MRFAHVSFVAACCAALVVSVAQIGHPVGQPVGILPLGSGSWTLDARELRSRGTGSFVIADVPLGSMGVRDLVVTRSRVLAPGASVVVVSIDGAEREIKGLSESVVTLVGTIDDDPDSLVYLAVTDAAINGFVRQGGTTVTISSGKSGIGARVFGAGGSGLPDGLPFCGEIHTCGDDPEHDDTPRRLHDSSDGGTGGPRFRGGVFKQVEIAVETDYELFELFGDAQQTAEYVVSLYGAVDAIYQRDVQTRVVLTYVRIWETPEDLFNSEGPLNEFLEYWNANMQHVHRDVAQLFMARRNLSAGGVAYVSSLCTSYNYSWAGYALGAFADINSPSDQNRDIVLTAHELGHSCGTYHTHDYGIDTCNDANTPERRGEIMAYCSQTVPGGDAITDLRFDTLIAATMREHIGASACIADDCNGNGIADIIDIQSGTSIDSNGDAIPDECQDCNGNGRPDPVDISLGAPDVDLNGVPDSCDPDCNGNGVPDARDIALQPSLDKYRNGIPDQCEDDADGDSISDYSEIMVNMPLDIDRNAILDDTEDCDFDGTRDLAALNFSRFVMSGSTEQTTLRQFHSVTGVRSRVFGSGLIDACSDLIVTADRRVLVADPLSSSVVEFSASGAFVGVLIAPGAGGLSEPGAMMTTSRSTLLVVSSGTNAVLEYQLADGAFVGEFISSGSGGLTAPFGIVSLPGGRVAVTSEDGRICEFHGESGEFMRVLVSAGAGNLSSPRGMAISPSGTLLVCSYANDRLLEFNAATGAFVRIFNSGGTPTVLQLDGPWCVRVGPDAHVYVSRNVVPELHINRTRIYRYNGITGAFLANFINGHASGLRAPSGFDFIPDAGTDCNGNGRPDSCDIASGASTDGNGDGRPDECDQSGCNTDVNNDGFVTGDDFDLFVVAFELGDTLADYNADGFVTGDDFDAFVVDFEVGC